MCLFLYFLCCLRSQKRHFLYVSISCLHFLLDVVWALSVTCLFVWLVVCIHRNENLNKMVGDHYVRCNYCLIRMSRNKKSMTRHARSCVLIPADKKYVFFYFDCNVNTCVLLIIIVHILHLGMKWMILVAKSMN